MICPSRIKEKNELLFGVDEVFIPCKEDIVINDFFEEGMADLDSDGLPDIEESLTQQIQIIQILTVTESLICISFIYGIQIL